MKVVFLDFDGVLNSERWADYKREHLPLSNYPLPGMNHPDYEAASIRRSARSIDPDAVTLLNRLVDETGAMIVVSSSWRGPEPTPERLEAILRHTGFAHSLLGQTPDLSVPEQRTLVTSDDEPAQRLPERVRILRGCTRWEEIRTWLSSAKVSCGIRVESFVIFDDEAMPDAPRDRLVRTQFSVGLTAADVDRAITILNREDGEAQ